MFLCAAVSKVANRFGDCVRIRIYIEGCDHEASDLHFWVRSMSHSRRYCRLIYNVIPISTSVYPGHHHPSNSMACGNPNLTRTSGHYCCLSEDGHLGFPVWLSLSILLWLVSLHDSSDAVLSEEVAVSVIIYLLQQCMLSEYPATIREIWYDGTFFLEVTASLMPWASKWGPSTTLTPDATPISPHLVLLLSSSK